LLVGGSTYMVQNGQKPWSITNPTGDSSSLRFEVRQGDVWALGDGTISPLKNRSEIAGTTRYSVGTDIHIKYGFVVEPGAANTASWLTAGQLRQTANDPVSAPFGIMFTGEHMRIYAAEGGATPGSNFTTLYQDPNNIVRGHEYQMQIDARFDPVHGHLDVIRDGVTLVNYDGPLGWNNMGSVYWKEGVYRADTAQSIAMDYNHLSITTGAATSPPPPVSPPPVSPPPVSPPPAAPPPVSPPPPTSGTGVTLTGSDYHYVLTGGAGNDTLIASVQGSGTMTGGAGSDTFKFGSMPWTPSHITDFQAGVDKLDLHALFPTYTGSDPIRDGYVSLADDGHGGTNVLVDPDGRATGQLWPTYVVDLDHVSPAGLTSAQLFGGGSTAPTTPTSPTSPPPPPTTPTSPSGGVTLTGSGYNDVLTGGAGNDTLIGSTQGSGTMTGGAGSDIFRFGKMPWTPSHITDFQVGVDKLDLHGLYPTYTGSNPVGDGYVTLADDGHGGTNVLVNPDGHATAANPWPTYVVDLDHVARSSLTSANWLI
jgi:Ca2+-binding RTX toxin-like protein